MIATIIFAAMIFASYKIISSGVKNTSTMSVQEIIDESRKKYDIE